MIDDETWRKMWKLISADVELHTFGRITVRRHVLRRRGELGG